MIITLPLSSIACSSSVRFSLGEEQLGANRAVPGLLFEQTGLSH